MISYLALGAAGVALLLLAAVWLRSRVSDVVEPEVADALADVNERMERLAGELTAALDRARAEGRRGRALGELSGSIDLDEVLTRTLEAATAGRGVDAAVVSVRGPGGEPVVAGLGVDAIDPDYSPLAAPPDGRRARAIKVAYVYEREGGLRSGLAVPLEADGEQLGFLAVYARSGRELGDDVLAELEELARHAGPAIDNARRFREARQLADLDALTGLHNRRYFHETLGREVARAHRYQRALALVVLDLDDFKSINDHIGHLAGDAVLAEAAERLRDVVRSADVACRVGGDEFAIILPESTVADADGLYRRLGAALQKRPVGQAGTLALSAGVAELRPDDDAVTFFERADEALYRAKSAGKNTLTVADAAAPPVSELKNGPSRARSSSVGETAP
jgi:diguanylate cyclase (GGDEF)-like protein